MDKVTPFFPSVKNFARNLDTEVKQAKRTLEDFHFNFRKEETESEEKHFAAIDSKWCATKREMYYLRTGIKNTRCKVGENLKFYKDFHMNMHEFSLDILDELEDLEKHLVEHGYQPPPKETHTDSNSEKEVEAVKSNLRAIVSHPEPDLSKTPPTFPSSAIKYKETPDFKKLITAAELTEFSGSKFSPLKDNDDFSTRSAIKCTTTPDFKKYLAEAGITDLSGIKFSQLKIEKEDSEIRSDRRSRVTPHLDPKQIDKNKNEEIRRSASPPATLGVSYSCNKQPKLVDVKRQLKFTDF